jgi:outer membrane protein assembly factor BamB
MIRRISLSAFLLAAAFCVVRLGIADVPKDAASPTLQGRDTPHDWPRFNGPRGDNISRETGLLKEWPKDGPSLAWKATGFGSGYSSVSVAGGRIFTAGDEDDSAYVVCVSEADGKPIWKKKLGRPGGDHPGTRSTPTVDGDSVYMLGQWGDLVCYAVADGEERWRTNLNKDYGGKMMSGWGNAESVVIDGEKLLCTPGGKGGTLLALNKETGKEIWRSAELTDAAAYMSPVVAEMGGARQAVVLTARSVAGITLADGKLLWRADRKGETAVVPTPIVHENFVYVTSGYGVGCDLFQVDAKDGEFSATRLYSNDVMVDHHGGVVLVDGYIYGHSDHGGWTCQDLMSGKAKWQDRLVGKGTITYADGRFYIRGEGSGDINLLDAGPDHHTVVGKLKQPDRSRSPAWAHLVIANGHLYVRDGDVLLCYDVRGK